MSTSLGNLLSSKVVSNLDTYTATANAIGNHAVIVQMTMQPSSSLSIVIKQNGTTVATSTTPTPGQTILDLIGSMYCAVGDSISIVVSSSAPSDSAINTVKGIITIHGGANFLN